MKVVNSEVTIWGQDLKLKLTTQLCFSTPDVVSKTLFYGNKVILRGSWAFPDSSGGKEASCNARDPGSIPGLGRSAGEGIGYPTPVFLGFLCSSAGKESACNAGDLGSMPGLGSPREGKGYPLQYSGLENSMDYVGSQRVGHDQATFTFARGSLTRLTLKGNLNVYFHAITFTLFVV